MATKQIVVKMPNIDPKGKVNKFEVDSPKESLEPIKNIYVSKKALAKIGNPDAVEVIVRPYTPPSEEE